MNIVFRNIHLHNFFSFADAEISLDDLGYVLVSGRNNNPDDMALSNGSGKSTIFNALCWVLTGETLQGINSNIENIFTNPNDCWVSVEFDIDDDHFYLRRVKTPRPDLKIFINEEDKSGKGIRESSQLLAQYIPDLNSKLIGSIIILGQGLPHRFTNNRPAQRKEILENLTKSDYMIQAIKDQLESRQVELRTILRQYEDKRIEYNTQIKVYNNQLKDVEKELLECSIYSSDGDGEDTLKDLDNRLVDINKEIKSLNKKIKSNLNNINKLSKESSEIALARNKELSEINNKYDPILNELHTSIVEAKTNKKNWEYQLKKLKSVTDICPTCGQKIPDVHVIDTTDLEWDVKNVTEELAKFNSKHLEVSNEKAKEYNKITEKFNKDSEELYSKLKELNSLDEEYNLNLTEFETEKTNLEELKNKYASYKEDIERLTSNKTELEEKLYNLNVLNDNNTKNINNVNDHLSVIQNLITLAKREFRGILLQSIIEYINKKVKVYSREIFETDLLSFTLEDNYIIITYDNKPYENLSGGEKQKVDIIIQLALRELLSNQLNIHSNILVVDECFDNLDVIGCQKILNLISNLDDVSSVFIITHHKDSLEISYDMELVVEKNEDSISTFYIV